MRFLADEGVDGSIVGAIREHETDLPGSFTVIQPGTIRIRRA